MKLILDESQIALLRDIVGPLASGRTRENPALQVETLMAPDKRMRFVKCVLCGAMREQSVPSQDFPPAAHLDDCPVYYARLLNRSVNLRQQRVEG